MIQAVIYDLDDLMVNSDPLHAKAWELLLKDYGHTFKELPENFRAQFIGMRVIDILREIHKTFSLPDDIEILYSKRTNHFLRIVKDSLEAMPGLIESLSLLKENKYKLAIASSGSTKYIDLVVQKFQLKSYFDVIVTGDDVHKGKPDPETYIVACQKLGVNPKESVVLEDATKGIKAAKRAGCKCIAVKNPYTPTQDVSRADVVINSLRDITIPLIASIS